MPQMTDAEMRRHAAELRSALIGMLRCADCLAQDGSGGDEFWFARLASFAGQSQPHLALLTDMAVLPVAQAAE